jgi:hypothetical protein
VLQPFEDDSVTSVEHHCSILTPFLSLALAHLPDPSSTLILQLFDVDILNRRSTAARRISSRRPHLHLEAIEEIDHTFELAVISCTSS